MSLHSILFYFSYIKEENLFMKIRYAVRRYGFYRFGILDAYTNTLLKN